MSHSVDELIGWLRAQLDADALVARKVAARSWTFDVIPDRSGPTHVLDLGDHDVLAGLDDDDPLRPVEVEHIARWDPARVLAEVDAKRRILDEYEAWATDDDDDHDHSQTAADSASALLVAVRLLALPYAGREGWRTEWTT